MNHACFSARGCCCTVGINVFEDRCKYDVVVWLFFHTNEISVCGCTILLRDDRWVDVSCSAEDAIVFNCGDYLSLFTEGRLK